MEYPDGMCIPWQSNTSIDRLPFYVDAIGNHARQFCAAGTMLEMRAASNLLPGGALHSFCFFNNRAQPRTVVFNAQFHKNLTN